MSIEELERLQLEIAISESLSESSSHHAFATPEELAFFSDLSLDNAKKPAQSKPVSSSSASAANVKPTSSSPSPIRPAQPTSKPSASSSSKPPSTFLSSGSSIVNALNNALHIPILSADHCATCGKLCNEGRVLTALNKKYHECCFVCAACHNPIKGQFAPRGNPQQPYHIECATMLFTPVCCVCSNNVTERYLKHPFFDEEVYCCTHVDRNGCFSCGKKEPLPSSKREKFTDLNDGRSLCPRCASTIIMDSNEVRDIYLKVVDYMETWQGLVIPPGMRDVPVFAVDVQCLNEERLASQGGGGICRTSEGTCRGLTMSQRGEIRQMSGGSVQFDRRTGQLSLVPTVVKVEEVRAVTAVLVLYGLPEEQATSIIAHEAMHVWFKLTRDVPFALEPKVEEGLCQVMAYMYLEHVGEQRATGKADSMAEKEFQEWRETELLRSYLCHAIQTDISPVYGDGFREAFSCVKALGLHEVIGFLKSNRKLPCV